MKLVSRAREGGWRRRDRKVRHVNQGNLSVAEPVFRLPLRCRRAGPAGVRTSRVARKSRNGDGVKGTQEGGWMMEMDTESQPAQVPTG